MRCKSPGNGLEGTACRNFSFCPLLWYIYSLSWLLLNFLNLINLHLHSALKPLYLSGFLSVLLAYMYVHVCTSNYICIVLSLSTVSQLFTSFKLSSQIFNLTLVKPVSGYFHFRRKTEPNFHLKITSEYDR